MKPPPLRQTLLPAGAMLILSVSEVWRLYLSDAPGSPVARAAFLLLIPALLHRFTLREWALTSLAAVLTFGIWSSGDAQAILRALDRAAFFAAFIYLVTLLKEAAQRSRSVLALGSYLTQQPQGRRYYALSVGGHAMGVLLNFGAISLLTPLIQRGAKAMGSGDPAAGPTAAQLEQQQISALLRGFSWMIIWSPTALTQAVLYTSFPTANAAMVIALGISASITMILIGRALDRVQARRITRAPPTAPPPLPRAALRRFGAICATLIVLTFVTVVVAGVSAAIALMLIAPVLMVSWVFAQRVAADRSTAPATTLRTLQEIFIQRAMDPAQSAYILGMAGYIGVAAAALAPVDLFAAQLDALAPPPWLFLATLPVLITLGGQLALSPILVVVFLAAVINELPSLPADPTLIIFSLGAGWALSMTASPNASATLLIASITRVAPTTLTWRWNGHYALVCYLAFGLSFWVLAR